VEKKFKNIFRISSARWQNWNYSQAGAYFITICSKGKKCVLGKIVDEKLILTDIGKLATDYWYEIKNHSTNIELGEFVVMPNHIHGILVLNNKIGDLNIVETGHALSQEKLKTMGQQRFQHIGNNSVSSIIGSYKSAVSKQAHRLGYNFEWQTRFYDHIIRTEKEYFKIADYILTNVLFWGKDILNEKKQLRQGMPCLYK